MKKLFVALYNANLFAKVDREKRVALIKKVAGTNVLNPARDATEGKKQVLVIVGALAERLNDCLEQALSKPNPEYSIYENYEVLDPIPIDDFDSDFALEEETAVSDSVPRTIPVEGVLVDKLHFNPTVLSVDEVTQELLVFKEAGVKTGIELVDQYLDLF